MKQVLVLSDEKKKKQNSVISEEVWKRRIAELKEFHGEKQEGGYVL